MKLAGIVLIALGFLTVVFYSGLLESHDAVRAAATNENAGRRVSIIGYSGMALMMSGAALVTASRRRRLR